MPSLQVRELPENIYSLLQENAKKEHRSLAQEAIITLAKGLNTQTSAQNRRIELLNDIAKSPRLSQAVIDLDPVELLRNDRER